MWNRAEVKRSRAYRNGILLFFFFGFFVFNYGSLHFSWVVLEGIDFTTGNMIVYFSREAEANGGLLNSAFGA